jgi:hypothetical protein
MNICVEGGEFTNLRDGGYHLGTVCRETARDGKICPVEMLFNSETKPQKAGLEIQLVDIIWETALEATHDADQNPNQREYQSHLGNLGAVTPNIIPWSTNRRRICGTFSVAWLLAGCVVRIAPPDECPKGTR